VLATAPDEETAIVADLDFESQRAIRTKLPVLEHCRADAYKWSG
jgi:predicted amidohydrolase